MSAGAAASFFLSPAWAFTNALARVLKKNSAMRVPAPVISVGNIVAGGVGKTELVIRIAQELIAQGKRVTVSMRGYASEWESKEAIALDFEAAASLRFPDEALVALKKCLGVAVAVGRKRAQILNRHWDELRPDVVLLDDGFQHFSMHRDLDVLVHQFNLRFPLLRDFPFWLSRAGLRVSFSDVPSPWSERTWVRARYKLGALRRAGGGAAELPAEANLFCGIGNPQRLKAFVESLGVSVHAMKAYPDHQRYDIQRVESLKAWNRKNGGLPLLTTLKDFVKLGLYAESAGGVAGFEPLWLDISLDFLENEKIFWSKISEVFSGVPHPRVP